MSLKRPAEQRMSHIHDLHRAGENPAEMMQYVPFSDELRARFVPQVPAGWLGLAEAARALGVARQTVLDRVRRGELRAVHVTRGRRSGLAIEVGTGQGRPGQLFA